MQTLKLKKPVQFGSETIAELEIREPTAGDIRDMPLDMTKATMGTLLDLASRCTAQPPSIINKLSIEDATRLAEVIGGFLSGSPQTGETH